MFNERLYIFSSDLIKREKPRINKLLLEIGNNWDDLMSFFNIITSSSNIPESNSKLGSQVILRGETDGTMGMENVKMLLNWNPNATLLLSGGVYGREKSIGDIGAIDLYKHIEYDLSLYGYSIEAIKSRTIIDSFSRHTIDQGKILSGILSAINCNDLFIIMPLYHIPRFILVLSHYLNILNVKPNMIAMPYGDWTTRHPRKGPVDNIENNFLYEDLFVLPPVSSRFSGKNDCGEMEKIRDTVKNNNSMTFKQYINWIK